MSKTRGTVTVEIKTTTHRRASKAADRMGMRMVAFCDQCVLEGLEKAEAKIRTGKTRFSTV